MIWLKQLTFGLAFAALPFFAAAVGFKASLAQMPVYAESKEVGVLVDFVKALSAVSKQPIAYEVVPFARSMAYVERGQVDFHMPLIQPIDMEKVGFSLSSETIFHVNFVLYTRRDRPLDPALLAGKVIETDTAHTPYFPFAIKPSSSIEGSLRRLDAGRIDGFIFADKATDPVLKATGLNNIRRQFYRRFDVKIVLPKGGTGGPTDLFLSQTIRKMRQTGQFQKILGPLDRPYRD